MRRKAHARTSNDAVSEIKMASRGAARRANPPDTTKGVAPPRGMELYPQHHFTRVQVEN